MFKTFRQGIRSCENDGNPFIKMYTQIPNAFKKFLKAGFKLQLEYNEILKIALLCRELYITSLPKKGLQRRKKKVDKD